MSRAGGRGDESRRGGELQAQQVGTFVRVLCGLAAAGFLALAVAVLMMGHGAGRLGSLFAAAVGAAFGAVAAYGIRLPVIDPVASKRFHELADPARPLSPEDFQGVPREAAPTPPRR